MVNIETNGGGVNIEIIMGDNTVTTGGEDVLGDSGNCNRNWEGCGK